MIDELTKSLLDDMRFYAGKALTFLGDIDLAGLHQDEKTLFAIVRAVEIVGEAASQVPQKSRTTLPLVPWKDAINMRHVLVHGYRIVRTDLVYTTVRNDFPPLIAIIDSLLGNTAP